MFKKTARYCVVIAANMVLFWFLYQWFQKNIHWHELTAALQMVPRSGACIAFVLGIATMALYALRLGFMINLKAASSFWIIAYGFGANNILPFRLGDALKIYFARKYFNVPATRLVFVKVMEKFFDLSALLIVGVWAVIIGGIAIQKTHLIVIGLFLAALLAVTIIAIFLARGNIAWVAKLRRHPRIDYLVTMFETVITNPAVKKAMAMTICIWAVTIGSMYAYYHLVLPDISLHLTDILVLVFLTSLSLGIPSVPGALGLFEAAIVFYLSKFLDVPAAQALACALVLHLMQAGPQIALMITAMVTARLQRKNQAATTRP